MFENAELEEKIDRLQTSVTIWFLATTVNLIIWGVGIKSLIKTSCGAG